MMDWYDGDVGWGDWIAMTAMMVLFWALVAVVVVVVVRSLSGDRGAGPTRPPEHRDPQQILDERLARGEIDTEEYRTRSDALRPGAQGPG